VELAQSGAQTAEPVGQQRPLGDRIRTGGLEDRLERNAERERDDLLRLGAWIRPVGAGPPPLTEQSLDPAARPADVPVLDLGEFDVGYGHPPEGDDDAPVREPFVVDRQPGLEAVLQAAAARLRRFESGRSARRGGPQRGEQQINPGQLW
jgi:hypothetical protein